MRIILFCFLICSAWIQIYATDAIYVSTHGNDCNNGSFNHPLNTINSALIYSRKNNIKKIVLRGGMYYDVNLKLTSADSGLIIKNYKQEHVVLYGGIPISKFTQEDKLIVATLPVNKQGWDFRMILVNGVLRDRSRLPERGYFQHQNEWNIKVLPSLYGSWERKPTAEELSQMQCNPKDIAIWRNDIKNAEISLPHQWDESYLGIKSIDSVNHTIKFSYPAINVPGAFGKKEYVVWNTREGLTLHGQWYWDKDADKVYYLAKENETVKEIIVPSQRNVIELGKHAKNITLDGVTIASSCNHLQNEGFACMGIDAAITGDQASDITVQNLTMTSIGGNAIRLKGRNITIKNVKIKNSGGGGIYCAGNNITIEDCKVDSMGLIYSGAVGIQENAINTRIIRCTIQHTPYSGICIGNDSCLIADCTIKYPMTFLQDGAAIYSSGFHKNIIARNNLIIGNNTERFNMGIYFDEQNHKCVAENNVVVNCGIPVHCHMAKNIIYQNNLFLDMKTQHVNSGGSFEITLNRNLFVAPSIIFSGPSQYDAKVDTTILEPKLRKFANPTGIISFQNNLLLITDKLSNIKLPHIDKALLLGTLVKQVDKTKLPDIKKILKTQIVKEFIDLKKINLDSRKLKEIEVAQAGRNL